MKITCAKKFDSLDSMIQDMENALDDAQVNSSTDVVKADIEFIGTEKEKDIALDAAFEAEKATNDLQECLSNFETVLDKFESMFKRTEVDFYNLDITVENLDIMLNEFLNDIDDVYLKL